MSCDKSIMIPCDPCAAAHLFEGWEETMIWSCLQGIMGVIYTDNEASPSSAAAVLGDFCFLAGQPSERFINFDYGKDFLITVPQNSNWSDLIEKKCNKSCVPRKRYAIKKEPDCFDRNILLKYAESLPGKYELHEINRELYDACLEKEWSRSFVAQFPTYGDFERLGVGFVITDNKEIVSGASSYSRYRDGIEIEIDTKKDCRRKGLATAAGAALILKCLDKGLYPSWDAHNPASVALAKKLGYSPSHEYRAYEIRS